MNLRGKKLLIIGGAFQHVKIVESAHALGIETYVVDYLAREDAPAKQISDHDYDLDIFDTDVIVQLCKDKHIDAVLACNLDICQNPYQRVCEKLGVPCFGTKEQFHILTDKPTFKKVCIQYGLDVIPEYTEDELISSINIEYPIFIKPTEASSSKGQTICYSKNEVAKAISFAKSNSRNGGCLIEKYMGDKDDFSVSGLMIDGKLYITRTSDRFLGTGVMNKSEIAGISPSKNENIYFQNVHQRLEKMLVGIGLTDAPVFFQGFVDGNTIRFYDPGLRFPGAECEKAYLKMTGMNLTEALVRFAFTGQIPDMYKEIANVKIPKGMHSLLMYFPLLPGRIRKVLGETLITSNSNIVAFCKQYKVGDYVGEFYNAKQRFGEIDMVCGSVAEMKEMVRWVYDTLKIYDEMGTNMMFSMFNPSNLDCYD